MAWDSGSSRRRQNSNASAGSSHRESGHGRQPSQTAAAPASITAKSPHVADPFLQAFLDPAFDPASYLNATLPSLQIGRVSHGSTGVPLAELSTRAQTTLSQVNAHTTRLTNTLTQLTDEILRSGSRLAYEVELLRGETLSLAEALTDGLQDDIVKFVPEGIKDAPPPAPETKHLPGSGDGTHGGHHRRLSVAVTAPPPPPPLEDEDATLAAQSSESKAPPPNEPSYITQLRTLTLVRSRLDSVIKTFGEAMEFVFPPSEVSVSSSFLSVSAPDAGGQNHSTEEKGQQVLQALREEIQALLRNKEDLVQGIEAAARRIEELKELGRVWQGTAEEKGRAKFVESLAKMVEDKHRELLREMDQSSSRGRTAGDTGSRRAAGGAEEDAANENKGYGAYGLISQLQKLRTGL